MFSKQRDSKKEFVGMIRNIFGNNSKPTEKRKATPFLTETTDDRNSFKKVMKSKFSFMRADSFKIGSNRKKLRASPDRQGMFGKFKNTKTSNLHFENMDATLNLSSILKKSNSSRTSFKKSLRFVDDAIVEDLDASMMSNNQNNMDRVSFSTTFDTITSLDSSAIQMGETDEDYYKTMKEKLLSKNKGVAVSKPKRHKKSAISINMISEEEFESLPPFLEDCHYNKPEQEIGTSGQNSKVTVFGDIHKKFDSITYLTPIASPLEKWTCTQSNLEISGNLDSDLVNDASQNLDSLPNNIVLNNLQTDHDQSYMETPEGSSDVSPAPLIFDSIFKDFSGTTGEMLRDNSGFGKSSNFNGKISSVKKSKGNRFDPIAKTETCAVSLLKDTRKDSDRMSWCSINSF